MNRAQHGGSGADGADGNHAIETELVRLTSGAVISLLGLAEETGGVPAGLWRDPYALGFVYGTVCGLSVRVLAAEDAELAPLSAEPPAFSDLELDDWLQRALADDGASGDEPGGPQQKAEQKAGQKSDQADAPSTGQMNGRPVGAAEIEAVEAAVARHDLAGVMSDSFDDILQFSRSEFSEPVGRAEDAEAGASNAGDINASDFDAGDIHVDDADADDAASVGAAGESGAEVLARAADLMLCEQPDFLEGLRAADKVVAVALGFPDYDADIDVITARRRADAARIDPAALGLSAQGAIDGVPANLDPVALKLGRIEMRSDDMIIDITKLIAGSPEHDDENDDGAGAAVDEEGGDLYLLSQDEAAVLYLQERLFCQEVRRRLAA